MININVPYDFKEKVWYVHLSWKTYYVSEGEVFGIQVYNRKGQLDTRVVFKNGSASIDLVFKNEEEAQKKAQELQEKLDENFK